MIKVNNYGAYCILKLYPYWGEKTGWNVVSEFRLFLRLETQKVVLK
jgi:hypothetical protein